jgi:hypothetical protein
MSKGGGFVKIAKLGPENHGNLDTQPHNLCRMSDTLRTRIRQVLLNDWDPHNASRLEAAQGTYDAYLSPLADLIQSGADEQQLVEWLHEREKETMCFPSLGTQRLHRVAKLLLKLCDEM